MKNFKISCALLRYVLHWGVCEVVLYWRMLKQMQQRLVQKKSMLLMRNLEHWSLLQLITTWSLNLFMDSQIQKFDLHLGEVKGKDLIPEKTEMPRGQIPAVIVSWMVWKLTRVTLNLMLNLNLMN